MSMNFKDKVAIVTGAASGIGKATAYALSKHGASVVVADINTEKGSEVSRKINENGYRSIFVDVDTSKPSLTNDMIDKAIKEFGKVDILVNNAGIEFNDIGNILEMPYDKLDRILQVNLYGYINCARSVIPKMIKRGQGGKVVNVSSLQGFAAHLPGTSYQVSKAGILGLTISLAIELAPYGINVNAVAPGAIATEGMGAMRAGQSKIIDAYRRRIPWGRRGKPEEVTYPILFLCSDYASYITGAVLVVDAGYSIALTPDSIMPIRPLMKDDPDLNL